ncbi:ROK family protein [Paenibacillus thermoaerophilus]|uniref:ROK family protein n=1 Tax=Paenibacillus thermoaerophilus TaxID=1215385 RepID=A0ABW2V1U5_9BACL|nr:ROK family protein [Paenibacillus thermoaerophilus]
MKIEERLSNRKAKDVMDWMLRHRSLSKLDLKDLTGLPGSTLTRILEELTAIGLLQEHGYGESTGGRPPVLFRVNPEYAYVFGVDISRSATRLVLADMHLNKLESHVWTMNDTLTPDKLIGQIADIASGWMRERKLGRDRVLGVGVGAVGPLDRVSGVLGNPRHFPSPGWEGLPIVRMLEERLQLPVVLDNGANMALLGEYFGDPSPRLEHYLYLHVAVGIRSAMMSGGELVYGAVDMEGAVGQMIIEADGRRPPDGQGNFGSLETYVSTQALEAAARSALKQGRRTLLTELVDDPDRLAYSHLEEALRAGDELARELFSQSAVYFGIGLANLLNILHPQKVIFGGTLLTNNPQFIEQAVEVAKQKTYHYPAYQVEFSTGKLGEDAVALGAVAAVQRRLTL